MRKNISGRSMIEMLGVLAIIGVLSAGGIMGYSVAMENYRVNKLITDIQMIAQQTIPFYDNNKYPATNTQISIAPQLKQLGVMSKEGYKIPINKSNMWVVNREYVTAECLQGNDSASLPFRIKPPCKKLLFGLGVMPKSVCVKLWTHNWGDSGYIFVSPYMNNSRIFYNRKLTPAEANTMCETYKDEGMYIFVVYRGTKVPR